MAAKMEHQTQRDTHNAWLIGLLALLMPGSGHFLLKRFSRAIAAGGAIWLTFIVGIMLGGHLYGSSSTATGFLAYVFSFCNMGSGLLYFISRAMSFGTEERAYLVTSEYGNIFIIVAGLLNYIFALDAFDIAAGRKQ
jgi:hypothetical protein